MKKTTQIFNDGLVAIYSIENIATPGNMPNDGLVAKIKCLRYEERTVGMGRFWTAMQAQAKISQMIRLPRNEDVSIHDVAIPKDGKQYKILQIQYPKEIIPHVMDLSLERLESTYEFGEY